MNKDTHNFVDSRTPEERANEPESILTTASIMKDNKEWEALKIKWKELLKDKTFLDPHDPPQFLFELCERIFMKKEKEKIVYLHCDQPLCAECNLVAYEAGKKAGREEVVGEIMAIIKKYKDAYHYDKDFLREIAKIEPDLLNFLKDK